MNKNKPPPSALVFIYSSGKNSHLPFSLFRARNETAIAHTNTHTCATRNTAPKKFQRTKKKKLAMKHFFYLWIHLIPEWKNHPPIRYISLWFQLVRKIQLLLLLLHGWLFQKIVSTFNCEMSWIMSLDSAAATVRRCTDAVEWIEIKSKAKKLRNNKEKKKKNQRNIIKI